MQFVGVLRKIFTGGEVVTRGFLSDTDFRALTESSSDIIVHAGADARTTYISPSCTRVLGWQIEELVGRGPELFVMPEYLPVIAAHIKSFAAGEQDEAAVTMQLRAKNGRAIWFEAKVRRIANSEKGDFVVVLRDISERKELEEQMALLAATDGLTGVANRRAFDETLEREWARTLRMGGQMSLLLLDIDRFKDFNDAYGHQAGDDCLRIVATLIREALHRPTDVVSRYGGEEFAIVLPEADTSGALQVAERVRRTIADAKLPHLKNQEGGGRVTVSIGAATAVSRHGGTIRMPEGLIMAADSALYRAKRAGRNQVQPALLLTPEGPANVA